MSSSDTAGDSVQSPGTDAPPTPAITDTSCGWLQPNAVAVWAPEPSPVTVTLEVSTHDSDSIVFSTAATSSTLAIVPEACGATVATRNPCSTAACSSPVSVMNESIDSPASVTARSSGCGVGAPSLVVETLLPLGSEVGTPCCGTATRNGTGDDVAAIDALGDCAVVDQ